VKKTILSAVAVVAFASLACFSATARAQGAATDSAPSKIGLIDMAEVFQKYKKFEKLRDGLKSEIDAIDAQAKQMATQAQALQDKLKSGTYNEGSPEYKQLETQLIGLQTEFNALKAQAQRDFMRKESQIYKTVYLEVSDAVNKYAEYYKYTLILRFNRKKLEDADNPQEVLQGMNRQVIWSKDDDDITDSVVDYLNRIYERSAGGTPNTKPATGARRN
jgi:Skp family chaperone for outer membrane proteins